MFLCAAGDIHDALRRDAEVSDVRCIGLNKVGGPGNLVAIEFEPKGRGWSLLAEHTAR
jgi:hypothetical protein